MGTRALVLALGFAACGGGGGGAAPDAALSPDAAHAAPDAGFPATLDGNRDRLLRTYLARLVSIPTVVQSNGLRGADLPDVCALWSALDPSSRDTFLTLTHRLEGATLADGSHALDHVTLLYRVNGGMGATASDPGSCGGGEYNRLILSEDATLHAAQLAAFGGDAGALVDIAPHGSWRDSHDAGGPHAPFDTSDETNDGAPRGQTQYFADPASAAASSPLGRTDLETLVDPDALEIDQDYDCVHSSNPLCPYIFYGPACAPESQSIGVDIYTGNYGDFEATWTPSGC